MSLYKTYQKNYQGDKTMTVKGIDEKYLKRTNLTAEEIAAKISDYTGETVNTIRILSAGWDAMFGHYATVRASRNRKWLIYDGKVMEDNGWINERCL